jgi:hypothetical protein
MLKRDHFEQEGGEGSTNIQAVNYYGGLTYKDAKDIALDVFESNFYKLSNVAANVASERAEKMVENYLAKLQQEKPESIVNVNDPDIQFALFTAQKEYARSGNEIVGDMLVELLVERTKVKERNFKQIVLNEAIEILPKLNTIQLNILSILFVISYVRFQNINSIQAFKNMLIRYLEPYILETAISDNQFLHLEYCGCINAERITTREIIAPFKTNYPGLFSRGFSREVIIQRFDNQLTERIEIELFTRCLHNSSLFQINALDKSTLENKVKELSLDSSVLSQLNQLFDEDLMTNNQVKDKLIELFPPFEKVNQFWEGTAIKSSRLTTVGIAIAHANLKKNSNIDTDLEIWIN